MKRERKLNLKIVNRSVDIDFSKKHDVRSESDRVEVVC